VSRERAELKKIWGKDFTELPPDKMTKLGVLKALSGAFGVVHFSCHASFVENDPMRSALHLVPDPLDDGQRLTAADLMQFVRFRRNPMVCLSACSSGVMDSSVVNSSYGLAGSFLRAGARTVVGTRWPVYDETAAHVMVELHKLLCEKGWKPAKSLDRVSRKMRRNGRIEDWAAFGCIGLP
jgi:CHAT domain-containing protein